MNDPYAEALHWDLWKVQFCHCNNGQMSAQNMRLSLICDYSVDGIHLSKVVILPFLDTQKLLWRFFYWCVNSWLFPHSSFPKDAVELLFWIVSDIDRAGEQEVSWYGRIFHQRFELVATASAMNRISYFVYREKRNKDKRAGDSKPGRTLPAKEKTKKQSYDVHIVWKLDYFLLKDSV